MKQNETSAEIEMVVLSLLQEASNDPGVPARDASLGALGMDSLRLVEVIYTLEKQFAVVADEELMAELRTVEDLISLIVAAWDARECGMV